MVFSCLLKWEERTDGLMVRVFWARLSADEDTLEPATRVADDVPQSLNTLLVRKAPPTRLST